MAKAISTASSSTCTWLILCVWVDEAPRFLGFAVAFEGNWSVKVTCLPFFLSSDGRLS